MRLKRDLENVVNLLNSPCPDGTDQQQADCKPNSVLGFDTSEDALEQPFAYGLPGLRVWHAIFLGVAAVLACVVLICCCIKFRIPRTKQEIEGDYIRRKILKKFRQRLKAIQNQELDEMDLKRALDKIRAEFKSDTESLAHSEALSVGTLSSGAFGGPHSSTYRRASQIAMDISIEDLRAHSSGWQGRFRLACLKCCRLSKPSRIGQTEPKIVPIDTTVQPESSKKINPAPVVAIIDETKPKLKPKPSVTPKSEEAKTKGEKVGKAKDTNTEPSTSKQKPAQTKSANVKTESKQKKSTKDPEDTANKKDALKDTKAAKENKNKEKAELKQKKEQEKALQKQEKSAKEQLAKEAKQKKKKEEKKVSK